MPKRWKSSHYHPYTIYMDGSKSPTIETSKLHSSMLRGPDTFGLDSPRLHDSFSHQAFAMLHHDKQPWIRYQLHGNEANQRSVRSSSELSSAKSRRHLRINVAGPGHFRTRFAASGSIRNRIKLTLVVSNLTARINPVSGRCIHARIRATRPNRDFMQPASDACAPLQDCLRPQRRGSPVDGG